MDFKPLFRRSKRSVRQGDNKLTQYPQGISAKALFIEENVVQKFAVLLGCPTLLLVLCSLCSSFFILGFISRLHCVWLLWDHDAYVVAVAIAVWFKPRPTIRVLETRAVTELGYTAPSLLSWGVLGPKGTHQWKRAIRYDGRLYYIQECSIPVQQGH